MNREDLFVRMDRENNREYMLARIEKRTRKLTAKDKVIYRLNRLALPVGFDSSKKTIAVYGDRLGDFIKELSKDYNIVVFGGLNGVPMKTAWSMGIHYITYRKWQRHLAEGYMQDDMNLVDREIADIEKLFRRLKIRFLIFTDFSPTIQRAFCLAAKNLNIPIAHYEHTCIYNFWNDEEALRFFQTYAKEFTDTFWYWSKKNQEKIIGKGIADRDQSIVIGYPYKVKRLDIEKKNSILWIGDGETHTSKNPEVYYKLVETVFEYCRKQNIEFTYRPHPREKKPFYAGLIEKGMPISAKSLAEDLEGNKIVIGGKTTCVLEAGLYEDIVFQINWDPEIVGAYLFDNAYVLGDQADQLILMLEKALAGEIKAKEVPEESLLIGGCAQRAKQAIEDAL